MLIRPNDPPLFPNRRAVLGGAAVGLAATLAGRAVWAQTAAARAVRDARKSLNTLLAQNDDARRLNARATGVIVFPGITKAGFIFGAENGEGVLFIRGRPSGFFQATAGSFGLQAGAQVYSLALFFMNPGALDYVRRNHGLSIGAGPNVVAVDQGKALGLSTMTGLQDIYAFAFNQTGLMAGLTINGSKITEIEPPK